MAFQTRTITVAVRAALWAAILICAGYAGQAYAGTCENLAALQLPFTTVTVAQSIPAGSFTPPGSATTFTNLPAFCRVTATVTPVSGSSIGIEVWLPTTTWNGKYMQSGNHGFGGSFQWGEMTRQIQRGYSTGITDDGHIAAGFDVSWAFGNPQKVTDLAWRAVHELNVNAKLIVQAYYGQAAKYVYFNGCSDGGREGLQEAQMFPTDFNGIIAGGVASNWTASSTQLLQLTENYIAAGIENAAGQAILTLVQNAVTAACDGLDGVVDGIISDPRRCHWDPNSLICTPGQNPSTCITQAQAAAIKANTVTLRDPVTGIEILSNPMLGSQAEQMFRGWENNGTNNNAGNFGIADYQIAYNNPNWSASSFNLHTDPPNLNNSSVAQINATNPNLLPFQAAGGKLIHWAGWVDSSFNAGWEIQYYGNVIDTSGGGNVSAVQNFYRLFMMPGVGHCADAADIGPDNIGAENQTAVSSDPQHDVVSALEAWVEQGVAPTQLIATKYLNNNPTQAIQMQRPICPYPQQAIYSGLGNTNVATSFYCGRLDGEWSAHDFDGDGKSDIALRDTSGNVAMWLMSGSSISQANMLGNVTNAWQIIGQRDFDADGDTDILWRDKSGNVGIWLMNGTQIISTSILGNVPANWSVAATGDFNGDGKADIVWRDTAGNVGIWLMNGTTIVQAATIGNVSTNWAIAGADARGEIFWRNTATGEVAMWVMNGIQVAQTVDFGQVPSTWTIAGIGDFDANGFDDILWRDKSGNVGIWLMNGTQIMSASVLGNVPASWNIAQIGDYNGDTKSDILWIDSAGNVATWFMNGATVASVTTYGNVGTAWAAQAASGD